MHTSEVCSRVAHHRAQSQPGPAHCAGPQLTVLIQCTQVPVYLAAKYRRNGVYKDARTILAIHNLSHQGVDPAATFANLGLPDDMRVANINSVWSIADNNTCSAVLRTVPGHPQCSDMTTVMTSTHE